MRVRLGCRVFRSWQANGPAADTPLKRQKLEPSHQNPSQETHSRAVLPATPKRFDSTVLFLYGCLDSAVLVVSNRRDKKTEKQNR